MFSGKNILIAGGEGLIGKQLSKLLIDKGATAANYYDALELWLPARVKPNITKIIVFYSGHGLPSPDAKELYLLAHDSRTASKLLPRTALLRSELFEQINNFNQICKPMVL